MEDEALRRIPTQSRTKIPTTLAYVAGAQMISRAWQNVPQFEFLKMSFSCFDVAQSLRPQATPRPIVHVSYRHLQVTRFSCLDMEQRGFYEPYWNVSVYACRAKDAHEVRQWLLDTGLELAREWLVKMASLHGRYTWISWSAAFDEEARLFSISCND